MLAGGGLKIAFQAGVLQVWLDEAGIEFDHGDGVSAAAFNLAMWAQGFSGTQIADNWRRFKPFAAVDVNWFQLLKLFYAESFFELNPFRKKFFREWGLDFEKIRASPRRLLTTLTNRYWLALPPTTPLSNAVHLVNSDERSRFARSNQKSRCTTFSTSTNVASAMKSNTALPPRAPGAAKTRSSCCHKKAHKAHNPLLFLHRSRSWITQTMESQTVFAIVLVGLVLGLALWNLSLRFRLVKFLINLFRRR